MITSIADAFLCVFSCSQERVSFLFFSFPINVQCFGGFSSLRLLSRFFWADVSAKNPILLHKKA